MARANTYFFSLVLCVAAAIIGSSCSLDSQITPASLGERTNGFYGDGWIADGGGVSLSGFAAFGNRAVIHFDPWRPPQAGPALLELNVCGARAGEVEVLRDVPIEIPLHLRCEAPVLQFKVKNPFQPSDTDTRSLAVRFKSISITSFAGVPLASLYVIGLVAVVLIALVTLWGYSAKALDGATLRVFVPLVGTVAVARVPDLQFSSLIWFAGLLLAAGAGAALAVYVDRCGRDLECAPESGSRGALIIAAGAVVVGFILRVWNIGFGLPLNFHPDEVPKVNAVMRMVSQGTLDPDYFLHPSLLLYSTYAMNILLHALGAQGEFRETAFLAGRMVSVVAGTCSIYLTYLLGQRLFAPRVGAIAALALAVFPLHVTCSRYLKEDALLTAFVLLTALAAVSAAEKKTVRAMLWAGCLAGLTASTKYTGLLAMAPVIGAPWLASGGWRPDRKVLRDLPYAFVAFPFGFLAGTPYALLNSERFLKHFNYERSHMARGHTGSIDAWSQYWMYYYERAFIPGLTFIATIAASVGFGLLIRWHTMRGLFIVGLLLLFYLPAEWVKAKPAPQPDRYILPCLPFAAILIGVLIETLRRVIKPLPALICGIIVIGTAFLHSMNLAREMVPDTRVLASRWMSAHLPRDSRVLLDWINYSPTLSEGQFQYRYLDRATILQELDLDALHRSGYQYLVLSSFFYDRYMNDPTPMVPGRMILRELFRALPKVAEFSAAHGRYGFHNPVITIFKIEGNG